MSYKALADVIRKTAREKFEQALRESGQEELTRINTGVERPVAVPTDKRALGALWQQIMLRPYAWVWQNGWAGEAEALLAELTPAAATACANIRGGRFARGNGRWAGRTALHWAVDAGFASVVDALLAIPGIDVDCRDLDGCTPLKLALAGPSYNPAVVASLAGHGASFAVQDERGFTPLHMVVLFHRRSPWLALAIMEHITDYDYRKQYHDDQTLLESALVFGATEAVVDRIRTLARKPAAP